MTKIVQVAGGTKSQQDVYVGPSRELTVDTSNHDLRIHDGVTPGGHPVLSRDNSDNRYQAKSEELTGILDFLPEERGFLARLGTGEYRIRDLTVNPANLAVSNADGYSGDPVIELAATITTEHEWTGQQLFQEVVQFNSGINADVAGDTQGTHTGDVVGNVTGNVTGDLTGDSAGTHTGPQIGDVDVRGHTLQLDADQIPVTAIAGLEAFVEANGVPIGVISMWSGSVGSIPAGWALCDGTGGTPNLFDRFIIAAGNAYDPGDTGGAGNHSHGITVSGSGSHNHSMSVDSHALTLNEIPSHAHGNGVCDNVTGDFFCRGTQAPPSATPNNPQVGSSNGTYEGLTESKGGGAGHSHGLTVAGDGSHTHTGSSGSTSHIPPYYALAYIMKIS